MMHPVNWKRDWFTGKKRLAIKSKKTLKKKIKMKGYIVRGY